MDSLCSQVQNFRDRQVEFDLWPDDNQWLYRLRSLHLQLLCGFGEVHDLLRRHKNLSKVNRGHLWKNLFLFIVGNCKNPLDLKNLASILGRGALQSPFLLLKIYFVLLAFMKLQSQMALRIEKQMILVVLKCICAILLISYW